MHIMCEPMTLNSTDFPPIVYLVKEVCWTIVSKLVCMSMRSTIAVALVISVLLKVMLNMLFHCRNSVAQLG